MLITACPKGTLLSSEFMPRRQQAIYQDRSVLTKMTEDLWHILILLVNTNNINIYYKNYSLLLNLSKLNFSYLITLKSPLADISTTSLGLNCFTSHKKNYLNFKLNTYCKEEKHLSNKKNRKKWGIFIKEIILFCWFTTMQMQIIWVHY